MEPGANPYLRDAVLTASREQLQLMLYDGAIRFTRQGIKGIEDQNWEQCFDGFNRAQKVVLELISALNYDIDRELCARMAGIYNFIYRKLVESGSRREVVPAQDALHLLEYQRETWLLLMDRLKREQPVGAVVEDKASSGSHEEELAGATYGTLSLEC
jgi:flagellar secretion chaperone FliS